MKKSVLRTSALGVALAMTLAACGGNDEQTEETTEATVEEQVDEPTDVEETESEEATEDVEEETEDTEATDETDEDTTEDGDATPSEGGTPVEINAELTDPETGDTITIVSALRDVPSERDASYIEDGGEVVYLEISIEAGDQFGGAIGTNDFYILYDGEEDRAKGTLRDEISAQGLEPLETFARRDGSSGNLWVALTVEGARADTYTGAYIRPETEILGEDEVLPEFRGEFTIPAP